MSLNMSLPPIPKFPSFLCHTFSKSSRSDLIASATSPLVGPGSYELRGSMDKMNVISFFPEDGSVMKKLKNSDDFMNPGPADYFLKKQEKKAKTLVFMDGLKKSTDSKGLKHISPGPGDYFKEELSLLKSKDKISFSRAEKKPLELNEIDFPGPGQYDFDDKSILMTKKQASKISFSFNKVKKNVLPPVSKLDCNLKTFSLDEKSFKLLFDFQSPKDKFSDRQKIFNKNLNRFQEISVLDKYIKTDSNEEKFRHTDHSSNQGSKTNIDISVKTNKPDRKSNFSKSRMPIVNNISEVSPSLLSNIRKNKKNITLLKSQITSRSHKGLKKMLELKKKNLLTLMDSNLVKKKTNENSLKKFIEKEIAKKINEKIEKKMIKEIFLLSSDVEEKRKNRGFTQSVRKLEFLNISATEKLPGPANYTIKRELGNNGIVFPVMKKKTIFDIGDILAQIGPGKYELPSIFDLKKKGNEKIDQKFNYMLKKVEGMKKKKRKLKADESNN